MDEPGAITIRLRKIQEGDASAYDELIPMLYDELHAIAKSRLRKERPNHTLGATALVNELYLRFIQQQQLAPGDRNEFMAFASAVMRNILVDYARSKKRLKRGGDFDRVPLQSVDAFLSDEEADEVLVLDKVLDRLKTFDERAFQVVQYRFFGGMTLDETAEVMDISKRTVQRSWTVAKAWLRNEVSGEINLDYQQNG